MLKPSELSAQNRSFQDLLVIDLSNRVSGAWCSRLFGDFGADVIFVENQSGHFSRNIPPFFDQKPGINRSSVHAYLNWNKSSVCSENKEYLESLIQKADVVITGDTNGVTFDIDELLNLLKANSIRLSITPYGFRSPYGARRGNDLTINARSGWAYINGNRNSPPLKLPGYQASYIAGIAAFISATSALLRRDDQLGPEHVDVSELEAFCLTVHPWGIRDIYEDTGDCIGPTGRRDASDPDPLYYTADGRISVAIADFRKWTTAMEELGIHQFAYDERLIPDVGRHSQDLSGVKDALVEALRRRNKWELFHSLSALRCPVGVVADLESLITNEQFSERKFMIPIEFENRVLFAPGPMATFEPTLWQITKTAPDFQTKETGSYLVRNRSLQSPPSGIAPVADRSKEVLKRAEKISRPSPLEGIRVMSLCRAWAGPFATELLAFLGADVIQVASPDEHDVWRRVSPEVPKGIRNNAERQNPLNTQGLYNSINMNKREITLDMTAERGRSLFWDLLPKFDVLIDNFRPTVLPSWGVNLETLGAARSDIIWGSISGYGGDGPYASYPAIGTTIEPMSGLTTMHGYEGSDGMNTGGLYPDPVAGYVMALGVCAALYSRENQPEPQRIDVSMMEAVSILIGEEILGYGYTGKEPKCFGNHHPNISPHNYYATFDNQWIAIAAEDETAWENLVSYIGDERLRQQKFATMRLRKENERSLDFIIEEWTLLNKAEKLEDELSKIDITVASVSSLYEMYRKPVEDLVTTGFLSQINHPEVGISWLPGIPWKFGTLESPALRAAPCVGEHSREVLMSELGISVREYDELVKEGITGIVLEKND